jgi:hypothetical protein
MLSVNQRADQSLLQVQHPAHSVVLVSITAQQVRKVAKLKCFSEYYFVYTAVSRAPEHPCVCIVCAFAY